MMLEIRDGSGRIRDLGDDALVQAIRLFDVSLIGGPLNELALTRTDPERSQLIFHHSPDGRYIVTHIDANGQARTAIADGDPTKPVNITVGGVAETWPGDHFVDALTAGALTDAFIVHGGRHPCVEWRPSMDHR